MNLQPMNYINQVPINDYNLNNNNRIKNSEEINENKNNYQHYILPNNTGNNNYQKMIQDLEYANNFLKKENLNLETELEFIKNKYNSCQNDIEDINKHISICKENQDKIISDLVERNNYLENFISKNDNNEKNKKEINLGFFFYKMKQILNINLNNNDEEDLNMIINNIRKLNDELNKYKQDLEKKDSELNELRKENELLKIKSNQLKDNNYNNNSNISSFIRFDSNSIINDFKPSIDYSRIKTPINSYQYQNKINDFISNYSNYNYIQNQIKIPSPYIGNMNPSSPILTKNNLINNYSSKTSELGNTNIRIYNTENVGINIPINNINNQIKIGERKLVNSHSLGGSLKFKTLKDFENDKNNKYPVLKGTLVNQQCLNSKNSLSNLMNNVAQLENALRNVENNI